MLLLKMLVIFTFFPKIRTQEPGPVLGNLDLNRSLVGDLYSGIWIRTLNLTRTHLCTLLVKTDLLQKMDLLKKNLMNILKINLLIRNFLKKPS